MKIIIAAVLSSLIMRCSGFLKMIKIKRRKAGLRSKNNDQLFDQYFIEAKAFYMKCHAIQLLEQKSYSTITTSDIKTTNKNYLRT
jgi:hypothetical protein